MNRTVTALYETRAQAEQVRNALQAVHLGDHVDIRDLSAADESGVKGHHAFAAWLNDLFGGHHDRHLYGEGIRRGNFLLAAKVDDLDETRAAEILDAEAPVDLNRANDTWRGEGWNPLVPGSISASAADKGVVGASGEGDLGAAQAGSAGAGVRVYLMVD
jgi:hypothetical protein